MHAWAKPKPKPIYIYIVLLLSCLKQFGIIVRMGNRGLLLVALCFCIVGSVISSEGGQVAKPFRVQGRVYCDNCRAGFETNITTYISGAKVRVVCKNRTSLAGVFSVEGETDSSGTYDIVVEHDHDDEICEVLFVSSPVLDCKTPDPGRNKSSIVLTRSNNGILNNLHYANSLGCFKDVPLPHCKQILQYYLSDV